MLIYCFMDGLCLVKMNHFSWKYRWSVEWWRVRSWLAKFSIIYARKYSNDIIDNVKDGDKSAPPPPPANDCLQLKHREIFSALFRILSSTRNFRQETWGYCTIDRNSFAYFCHLIANIVLLLHLANLMPIPGHNVDTLGSSAISCWNCTGEVCKNPGPVEIFA